MVSSRKSKRSILPVAPQRSTRPVHKTNVSLPPELWIMIAGTYRDVTSTKGLMWLWFCARHVSPEFRTEVERIFMNYHLRETCLNFHTGCHLLCYDVIVDDLDQQFDGVNFDHSSFRSNGTARFRFSHVSSDGVMAVFKADRGYRWDSKNFRRLLEKAIIGGPMFSISLYRLLNDTGMDDLQINAESYEISFDWTSMFTQLLGEERVYNMLLHEQKSVGKPDRPKKPWAVENSLEQDCRLTARRSRLRRKCQAEIGTYIFDDYKLEEKSALALFKRVKHDDSVDMFDDECGNGLLWHQGGRNGRTNDPQSYFGRAGIPAELRYREGRQYRYEGPKLTIRQPGNSTDQSQSNALHITDAGTTDDSKQNAQAINRSRPSNPNGKTQDSPSIAGPQQQTLKETQAASSSSIPPSAPSSSLKRPTTTDAQEQNLPKKRRLENNPPASLPTQEATVIDGSRPAQNRHRPHGASPLGPNARQDASIFGPGASPHTIVAPGTHEPSSPARRRSGRRTKSHSIG